MIEASCQDILDVLLVHGNDLSLQHMDNDIEEQEKTAHVVHPQETSVEGGALVLFKEFQIGIVEVARRECFPHSEHDIDVTWPFADDARYVSCAELLGLAPLEELRALYPDDSCEENR